MLVPIILLIVAIVCLIYSIYIVGPEGRTFSSLMGFDARLVSLAMAIVSMVLLLLSLSLFGKYFGI